MRKVKNEKGNASAAGDYWAARDRLQRPSQSRAGKHQHGQTSYPGLGKLVPPGSHPRVGPKRRRVDTLVGEVTLPCPQRDGSLQFIAMIATDSKNANLSSESLAGRMWFFAAVSGLFFALAISQQSFWIDEVYIALAARQPTLDAWWREQLYGKGSDLQMPLYMIWIWGCGKIFGTSEVALRAVNLFWLAPGMLALRWAFARHRSLPLATFLVAALSPFAWYYLNEARPYAMQIGTSLVAFALLFRLALNQDQPSRERLWMAGLCVAFLLLAASSMLAMLWLGAYLGAVMLSAPKSRLQGWARSYWPWWVGTGLLLFMLGLYYLWTLNLGARATKAGITDARNLFFFLCELFGFSGLGPGRLSIRTGGLEAFRPWLPWLAIYGGVLLVVLAAGWRSIAASTSRRTRLCWTGLRTRAGIHSGRRCGGPVQGSGTALHTIVAAGPVRARLRGSRAIGSARLGGAACSGGVPGFDPGFLPVSAILRTPCQRRLSRRSRNGTRRFGAWGNGLVECGPPRGLGLSSAIETNGRGRPIDY